MAEEELSLIEALQALAHERKIDEFYIIERLEESLAKSYERILDLEYDAKVTIDRQTGKIYVFELVPIGPTRRPASTASSRSATSPLRASAASPRRTPRASSRP